MTRILTLGLGHLSNGEITIAVNTLKRLHGNGYELLFVSHPSGARYIESMGLPAASLSNPDPDGNRRDFDKLLAEWKPEVLVCADAYTMDYAATWTGFDFAYLKSCGLPVGSFDQYEWESTNFICDFFGVPPVKMRESLILDADFLIRPCPLNKPNVSDRRIFTCSLFEPTLSAPKNTRSQWREHFSVPAGKKVIFTVNSGWEYVDISKSTHIRTLIHWMPRILHEHLSAVGDSLVVIHVGPRRWSFPISQKIDYRYFKRMDSSLYEESLFYADLFCGTNAISITLSRAVFLQVPSILFQNLKTLDFKVLENIMPKMPLWYREMAESVRVVHPFRIFPWGWMRFLEPIFAGNAYAETFATVPMFEPKKCINALQEYLYNDKARTRLREVQSSYFEKVVKLPSPEELFDAYS
ncbi:MAG: DUF6365 family protein [Actinomycetota bacterium]|nr:DUF6365 family protein [Actinomycetota bacterium]